MALITCKDCSKEISDKDDKCPHCGTRIPKPSFTVLWIILLVLFFAFLWFIGKATTSFVDAVKDVTQSQEQKPSGD